MTFEASVHHLDICARCGKHARQHEQNAQGTVPIACPKPMHLLSYELVRAATQGR